MKKSKWQRLAPWLLALFLFVGAELLLYFAAGTNCPVKALFGVPCPGCGMTRALFSLCTLDFAGAFYWHPLVFLLPPAALLLLLWKKGRMPVLIGFCVLLGIVFVLRLVLLPGRPPLDLNPAAPLGKLIHF